MAETSYGVNHPLAIKAWARILEHEALKECYFSRFIGKSSNSLIQLRTETQKDAGDKITIGLRMQLTGAGVQGDDTLEGAEEALVTYNDAIYINQLRHAVVSSGKMSEQRVPFSVRDEAKNGLRDWFADRLDTWLFNQLCGNTAQTDTRYTGHNATVAPSTSRILRAGGSTANTTAASISTTDTFSLDLIDKAVELAKTATPLIRPVRVEGDDMFVCFLHPYQVTDLRTKTSTGQWLDIQKAAMQGGKIRDNPIFTGALGVYNNVVLHESVRIPLACDTTTAVANTRRAVLCGAQAAGLAYGQGDSNSSMNWVEEYFDYQNKLGVAVGQIGGVKKSVYNSTDFATIAIETYAAAHT